MTPSTPYYVLVGLLLSAAAIVLASLATEYEEGWVVIAVKFGQNAGGILFIGMTIVYLVSQGVTMLAEIYKREQFQKGQQQRQKAIFDRLVKDKKLSTEERERYEAEFNDTRS